MNIVDGLLYSRMLCGLPTPTAVYKDPLQKILVAWAFSFHEHVQITQEMFSKLFVVMTALIAVNAQASVSAPSGSSAPSALPTGLTACIEGCLGAAASLDGCNSLYVPCIPALNHSHKLFTFLAPTSRVPAPMLNSRLTLVSV